MTKTYKQLQDEAELLGIKQNQSTGKLIEAIAEATTPKAVYELMAICGGLRGRVRKLEETIPQPAAPEILDILAKIDELHEAQMADKEVYTTPYLTGMANNTLVIRALITGESVDEEKLLKPINQVDVGGRRYRPKGSGW